MVEIANNSTELATSKQLDLVESHREKISIAECELHEQKSHLERAKTDKKESERKKEIEENFGYDLIKEFPGGLYSSLAPKEKTDSKKQLGPVLNEKELLQKRQESAEQKYSESIGKKYEEQVTSVNDIEKYTEKLDALDEKTKKNIHTEIIRRSLVGSKIGEPARENAETEWRGSKNLASGPLSPEQSAEVEKLALTKQAEQYQSDYEKALGADKKTTPSGDSAEKLLQGLNLNEDQKDAISLKVLKEGSTVRMGDESGLDTVKRMLAEKGLQEYAENVGKEDFDIRKLPDTIKQQIFGNKNLEVPHELKLEIERTKELIRRGEMGILRTDFPEGPEGDKKFAEASEKVMKEFTGYGAGDVANIQKNIGKKTGRLSPGVKFLADILCAFGASLEQSGYLEGNFWTNYVQEKKNSTIDKYTSGSRNAFEQLGEASPTDFINAAKFYEGRKYRMGGEGKRDNPNDPIDCSQLVVNSLIDANCIPPGSDTTAMGFASMSHKVGDNDGKEGDFLIMGEPSPHIAIITANLGGGRYKTIESASSAGGVTEMERTAGSSFSVYKNPFLSGNEQYADKLRNKGRGQEEGYNTEFHANEDYTPNPTEIAGVHVDMGPIQSWEGTDYLTNYPGSAASGHTLGHGYDLRFYSPAKIAADWSSHLTSQQIQIMQQYSGRAWSKGGSAEIRSKLENAGGYADFKSRVDAAKGNVLKENTLPKFIAETKNIYPEIINLEPQAQTALVSLVYNRGSGNLSSPKRVEMKGIQQHLKALDSYKQNGKEKEFYNKLADLFLHMNATRSDWPAGLKRRRREEAALIRECGGFVDPTKPEKSQNGTHNSAVQWFKNNEYRSYGGNVAKGEYDCMSSTHAALGLTAKELNAQQFKNSNIIRDGKNTDLWNVSVSAAQYAGKKIVGNKGNISYDETTKLYGGEVAKDTNNLEYYIEENVMERVKNTPIIDVLGNGKLIHYSKSGTDGIERIAKDVDSKLQEGEVAMMGSTGGGTNIGGHEWLIAKEGGELMVYEATNFKPENGEEIGVSGDGVKLQDYLKHQRRSKYSSEAIIFAKK